MSGLLGVLRTGPVADAKHRFDAACATMLRRNCRMLRSLSAFEGAWLLAQFEPAGRGGEPATSSLVVSATVLFNGVLYNEMALRRQLSPAETDGVPCDVGALISSLYAIHGERCIEQLEGEFCVAIIDPERRRGVIASDPIGNYPLYWCADGQGFSFSSSLAALLKGASTTRRLDMRAVADYVTIGAVLADRTLVEGVSLVPPGTVLLYDGQSQSVATRSYIELATFFHDKYSSKGTYLEAVEAEFNQAVSRALTSTRAVGLSLSGGLDSRALLSSAGTRAKGLRTYTLGVEGCADQVIAAELASIAGSQHLFFRLDDSYLRDFLPNMTRMVSLTDGMYLSHGLTEMLALQFLAQSGIEVLLRGHGGELAKAHLAWPLHTDDRVHGMTSIEQLVSYLSARSNYISPGLSLADLFTPQAARVAGDGSRSTFHEVLRDTRLSPAECCSYLYLRELNRRFTVPSLELFRAQVETRLPFLDPRFLKVLLAAPAEWRDATQVHRRLISAGIPRLVKVRNSNTGAPADASAATERLLDKCNTLLRRFNVRGFRHYHNFDAWMRRMLLESVESELLSPGAKVRGFVREAALAELIRDTRRGAADRSYLLQVLLILELWQRENEVEAAA